MSDSKVTEFNRQAWDRIAAAEEKWFRAATTAEIERARQGDWQLKLTPTRNVPRQWFGELAQRQVLCLAGGGGQQAPLLAAAGAQVTVADNSQRQLDRDRRVAKEHDLEIEIVLADMRDLKSIRDQTFDLIVNPTSVCYLQHVQPAWRECARVLKPGGSLLAGMMSPNNFLFDPLERERGRLIVTNKIPYSDLDLPAEVQERVLGPNRPVEFGHSLEDLIGGQVAAGLMISGFYTDRWGDPDPVSDLIDVFVATRSTKIDGILLEKNG